MNAQRTIACALTLSLLLGCASNRPGIEIRGVGGHSGNTAAGGFLSEGYSQLALGNVALALELFRKAARGDAASAEAQLGIATAYERMGRLDLARRHVEGALALAPQEKRALATLARIFERSGLNEEAAAIRVEIAALSARAERQAAQELSRTDPAAYAAGDPASFEGVAPERSIAAIGSSVTVELPSVQMDASTARLASVTGQSVTAMLPPMIPASPAVERAVAGSPKLERLSSQEVALRTVDGPRWAQQTRRPLPEAGSRSATATAALAQLRVLNGARVQGIAAGTRNYLQARGWRGIEIADAPTVMTKSLLLYPVERAATAKRLAAQFGFMIAMRRNAGPMTLILGRNAQIPPREPSTKA